MRKTGETWQEATRLAKGKKAFRIRLRKPGAWKGNEGLENEKVYFSKNSNNSIFIKI